jgi:hypothetical protein
MQLPEFFPQDLPVNLAVQKEKGFAITMVFLYKWFTIWKKLFLTDNSLISLLLQKNPPYNIGDCK